MLTKLTNVMYRVVKKNARILLPNKNGDYSINFGKMWLKFHIKVDETCMSRKSSVIISSYHIFSTPNVI